MTEVLIQLGLGGFILASMALIAVLCVGLLWLALDEGRAGLLTRYGLGAAAVLALAYFLGGTLR